MSFALLRTGALRFRALSVSQPRCALQLKSKGIQYYWLDYPYETLHEEPSLFDRPQYRLNDNSRSICVEGNVAVGKETLARNLADALYLKYFPDVNDDDFFIDKNYEPPLDYRDYNSVLPKKFQFYTTEKLFSDPDPIHHGRPLYLQHNYFMYRCFRWWKGCAHLFHTGQGFLMHRSPFSSYIFAKAMAECGMMSQDAKDWLLYYDKHVISALMYPHLVLYLRSPVQLSRDNLTKRGIRWEAGITDKFLETVKQVYESEFLPKMARYSEIYTVDVQDYNFNDANDVTYLAEQLCKIDLDQKHLSTDIDTKLIQWRKSTFNTDSMYLHRMHYKSTEPIFKRLIGIQVPDDLPEGGLTMAEASKLREFMKRDPRQTEWSILNPWDKKSTMDLLLGRDRYIYSIHRTYWFDQDSLKEMAYFRNFGNLGRSIEPNYFKEG